MPGLRTCWLWQRLGCGHFPRNGSPHFAKAVAVRLTVFRVVLCVPSHCLRLRIYERNSIRSRSGNWRERAGSCITRNLLRLLGRGQACVAGLHLGDKGFLLVDLAVRSSLRGQRPQVLRLLVHFAQEHFLLRTGDISCRNCVELL